MYRFFKGLLVVALSLAVVCCGLAAAYAALDAAGSQWGPFTRLRAAVGGTEPYYTGRAGAAGRELLDEGERVIYDKFIRAVFAHDAGVSVRGAVTTPQLERIFAAADCDYPEIFWLAGVMRRYRAGELWELELDYSLELEQRLEQQRRVEDAIAVIVARASVFENDYDRALFVHDYLAGFNEYDKTLSRENIYDVRGALLNGSTVCSGYAKAYSAVLNRLGIKNYHLGGTVAGSQTEHAWNIVELEGVYTLVDVTFDDPGSVADVLHVYFGASYTDGQERSESGALDFPATLPLDYYARAGLVYRDGQDVERLAARLVSNINNGVRGLEIRFEGVADDGTNEALRAISRRAGEISADSGVRIGLVKGFSMTAGEGLVYLSVEPAA